MGAYISLALVTTMNRSIVLHSNRTASCAASLELHNSILILVRIRPIADRKNTLAPNVIILLRTVLFHDLALTVSALGVSSNGGVFKRYRIPSEFISLLRSIRLSCL